MSDKSREYYSVTQMVQELIDSVEELTEEIEEVDPSAIDAKITAVDAKVARNAADIETNEGLITQLQVRATADEQAITGLDTRVAKLEEGGTAGGYTVTTETVDLDVSAGTGSTKVTFQDMRTGGFVIIQPYDDSAKESCEKSVEIKVTQEFFSLPTYTFTYDTKGRDLYYVKFLIIKATKKDDTTLKTINRVPRYLNTAWSGSTLVPSVDLITWNNDTITAVSATDYPEITELTLPYYKEDTTQALLGNDCTFSFNNVTTLNVLTSKRAFSWNAKTYYLPATITKLRFNYFPLIKDGDGTSIVFPRDCSDIEWSQFNTDGSFDNVFSTSLNAQLIVKNHIEDFNSLNSIKQYMFYNCPDVNLEITQDMFTGANSIDYQAFAGSSVKSVDSNVTRVESSAFRNCKSLVSVNLPNCTYVGEYAFMDIGKSLKKLLIPNCNSIGNQPFRNCTFEVFDSSLTSINPYDTYITKAFITRVNSVCDFVGILKDSSSCILYVPDDLYDSYIASSAYASYVDRIKKISEYTE